MQAFVINLKKHEKRKASISKQCEKYGLQYEIVNAVDGNTLSTEVLNTVTHEYPKCYLTKGEIGCALSHLNIYSSIIANDLDYALILEDDAVLNDEVIPNLASIVALISNKKPEVFLLSQADSINKCISRKNDSEHIYYRLTYGSGGHAYVINQAAAKQIMKCNLPIRFEADRWTDFRESINLKIWCPEKSIVNTSACNHEKSSLDAERKNNKEMRSAYRYRIKRTERFYQLKRFYNVLINKIGKIKTARNIVTEQLN